MAGPKVSVGMPCYNRQDYIGEAIESVLARSFRGFELLITDKYKMGRKGKKVYY